METLDHDYTLHSRKYAGDENLLVKFENDKEKDEAASLAKGRPIFKDIVTIDIRIAGDRDVTHRKMRPQDIERFPRHWEAFQRRVAGREEIIGTPLSLWYHPQMSPARIEEFRHLNIVTVEQLVGAPDSMTGRLMGFQSVKTAAKAWLEATKSAAPVLELTEKLNAMNLKMEEQQKEIARLTKALLKDKAKD